MSNYYLKIRISSKTPWKARKELRQYKSKVIFWDDIELMQYKGFRYIPTIVYTADFIAEDPSDFLFSRIGLPNSYFEEIIKTFMELRQKVSVRIVRPKRRGEYALWPNDVLNLNEVREEVNRLVTYPLLSKENPEDRRIVEKPLRSSSTWYKEIPFDEKIDREIEFENEVVRNYGIYFSRLIDISARYPAAKFWLYVETPG
ncbi:MAG: hypothetical protein N3F08_04295 [Crenarchaeota archaeon]|nr:hypothetical protein [Thermoproteota archaeon]